MCGRQFCKNCGQELIHRDRRKAYESSSALGQVLWRCGPSQIGVADIDAITEYTQIDKQVRLRVIEHKQPDHKFDWSQKQILNRLAEIFLCAINNPASLSFKLSEFSGVYVLKCRAEAKDTPLKETGLLGEVVIEKLGPNGNVRTKKLKNESEFFQWLSPEKNGRRKKLLAPPPMERPSK